MLLQKLFGKKSDYTSEINAARQWLHEADAIIIGIGDGLSAASGLDSTKRHIVREYFVDYYRMGYKSLAEIHNMYRTITDENAKAYWGYWARYIKYISYERAVGNGYRDLLRLVRNKNYMIYTSNIDSQVQKTGFEENRIFAPLGDGRYLRCSIGCCNKRYESLELLEPMIRSMEGNLEIKANKIPRCLHCGAYLIPEIQEEPSHKELDGEGKVFYDFIQKYRLNKIIFMDLGMNPSDEMKRFFEVKTKQYEKAHLISIYEKEVQLSEQLGDKAINIQMNLEEAIAELASGFVSL